MNRVQDKKDNKTKSEWYIVEWLQGYSVKIGIFQAASFKEIQTRVEYNVMPVTCRATKEEALMFLEDLNKTHIPFTIAYIDK